MGQICSTTHKATLSPPASPRFSRQPSRTSFAAARKLPTPDTLLGLCIDIIATHIATSDVNALPNDLIQLVYESIEEGGALDLQLLRRFDPKALHALQLGFYADSVDAAWLEQLGACSRARVLSLRDCALVSGVRGW